MAIKIRKGDTVAIIAGNDKGTMSNPRLGLLLLASHGRSPR